MYNLFKKAYIGAAAGGVTILPLVALAQTGAGPSSVSQLINLINQIATWFEAIVFILAIIMILVAAFQFLTAAGNEEKVATARKSLIWGLVGIAVALFARVAKSFVASFLGG
ncbi:MAG: hypothetical protein HYW90_01090 [Candidatus Sungbacteria bacterium]|nr:hypothetical protein [Candidatus Sungbacteria bacterium]